MNYGQQPERVAARFFVGSSRGFTPVEIVVERERTVGDGESQVQDIGHQVWDILHSQGRARWGRTLLIEAPCFLGVE